MVVAYAIASATGRVGLVPSVGGMAGEGLVERGVRLWHTTRVGLG